MRAGPPKAPRRRWRPSPAEYPRAEKSCAREVSPQIVPAGAPDAEKRESVFEAINRSAFRDAVRRFQRANGRGDDGIPGEDTLWALQADWASSRNIGLKRVDADLWVRPPHTLANHDPNRDGYDAFGERKPPTLVEGMNFARIYQSLRGKASLPRKITV